VNGRGVEVTALHRDEAQELKQVIFCIMSRSAPASS